jgi:hypothetical protein
MKHAGEANDSSTNCRRFQIPLISLPFMFNAKYVIQSTLKRPILAMYESEMFCFRQIHWFQSHKKFNLSRNGVNNKFALTTSQASPRVTEYDLVLCTNFQPKRGSVVQ